MEIFQGRSLHAGIAIAAAAKVQDEYGVLALDTQRLRQLGERLRRFGVEAPEPEQVVLIVAKIGAGFITTPLPGLEYAGVAAEKIVGDLGSIACPAIDGLPETLWTGVEEGDIIILDGDRGRVYVAPDAVTLSRYQMPFRHARRVFLGGAHLPARTASDDRPVAVLARAATLDDAAAAVEAGADGLWTPQENDFLGPESEFQSSAEQTEALKTLMELAGGKPIFLQIPSERLSLIALARAAVSGSLHLILDDLALRGELGLRLAEIEEMLEEDDKPFGTVHFEASVSTMPDAPQPETLEGYAGVWAAEDMDVAHMDSLLLLAGQARHSHKPLTLRLPEGDWATALPEALDLQADRVVTGIDTVEAVKDAIRTS